MSEFKCDACEGTFIHDDEFTDADALKEYEENGFIDEEKVSICDDCYNIVMSSPNIKESIIAWNNRNDK